MHFVHEVNFRYTINTESWRLSAPQLFFVLLDPTILYHIVKYQMRRKSYHILLVPNETAIAISVGVGTLGEIK